MTINIKSEENINFKFNCRENPFLDLCNKFSKDSFLEKKFQALKFKFNQLKSFNQNSLLFCGHKQLALKTWRHWFFYLKQNYWIIYCYAIKHEIIDPNIEERSDYILQNFNLNHCEVLFENICSTRRNIRIVIEISAKKNKKFYFHQDFINTDCSSVTLAEKFFFFDSYLHNSIHFQA